MRALIICGLAFALFASFALAMSPRQFVDDSEPNNQMIILLDLLLKQLCCRDPCNCQQAEKFGCPPKKPCPTPTTTTRRVRRALEPNNQVIILLDLLVKQLCCQQHLKHCNCKQAQKIGCRDPPGGCPPKTTTPTRRVRGAPDPNNQIIILLDLLVKQLCCHDPCNCLHARKFGCSPKKPCPKITTRRVRGAPEPNNQIIHLLDLLVKQLCCQQHRVACNCKQAKKIGCREPLPGICPPKISTRRVRRVPNPNQQIVDVLDLLMKELCCQRPCDCKHAKELGCRSPPPGRCFLKTIFRRIIH